MVRTVLPSLLPKRVPITRPETSCLRVWWSNTWSKTSGWTITFVTVSAPSSIKRAGDEKEVPADKDVIVLFSLANNTTLSRCSNRRCYKHRSHSKLVASTKGSKVGCWKQRPPQAHPAQSPRMNERFAFELARPVCHTFGQT